MNTKENLCVKICLFFGHKGKMLVKRQAEVKK